MIKAIPLLTLVLVALSASAQQSTFYEKPVDITTPNENISKAKRQTLDKLEQTLALKIKRNWRPAKDCQLSILSVQVAHSGKVKGIRLQQSSGQGICDEAAITAVTSSEPFPRLPGGISQATIIVKFDANLLQTYSK